MDSKYKENYVVGYVYGGKFYTGKILYVKHVEEIPAYVYCIKPFHRGQHEWVYEKFIIDTPLSQVLYE